MSVLDASADRVDDVVLASLTLYEVAFSGQPLIHDVVQPAPIMNHDPVGDSPFASTPLEPINVPTAERPRDLATVPVNDQKVEEVTLGVCDVPVHFDGDVAETVLRYPTVLTGLANQDIRALRTAECASWAMFVPSIGPIDAVDEVRIEPIDAPAVTHQLLADCVFVKQFLKFGESVRR